VVHLPEDAQLTVDGEVTVSTSAKRMFVSPALESDKDFTYTLVAKVIRDGESRSITREVTVRAGEETHVTLEIPGIVVAAN
jgi:uncharacterized protein (TIGR03000 family)